MNTLVSMWTAMSAQRRFAGIVSLAVLAATLGVMVKLAAAPSFSVLYSGLEQSVAGEVIAELDKTGVRYEVRNGTIYVDRPDRDRLRLELAASGYPATGGEGYELLDNLSGFGTTAQMFGAAYWRAKEGELARTVSASPAIRTARVHISNTEPALGRRGSPTSASVVVMPTRGTMRPEQASALRFLVSSAVAGMTPEMVSVIDASTGTLVAGNDDSGGGAGKADHAEVLRERVLRLVQARVGRGQATVEVNVEMQRNRETIFERRIDPETRVAISSETTETSSTSDRKANGEISVASNLPDGDADASDIQNSSQKNETRERVNYEVSETTRELEVIPGAIARVGVAVMVNEEALAGSEGQTPDTQGQLAALEELVKSTIGYNNERGDTVTIFATRMATADSIPALPDPSFLNSISLDATKALQISVLGIVAIALSLGVVRPLLRSVQAKEAGAPALLPVAGGSPPAAIAASLPPSAVASQPQASAIPILEGEISSPSDQLTGQAVVAASQGVEGTVDPVEHLKSLIDGRGEEAALVLQNWLEPSRAIQEGHHVDT